MAPLQREIHSVYESKAVIDVDVNGVTGVGTAVAGAFKGVTRPGAADVVTGVAAATPGTSPAPDS